MLNKNEMEVLHILRMTQYKITQSNEKEGHDIIALILNDTDTEVHHITLPHKDDLV